jgi:glyoxylase-like metal-dependent hydrolase (beta-lactamase superfamily II)
LTVIHTPGHTPGSTSLLLDGAFLFAGDAVMKTSIGRPDLGGKADEWAQMLYDTLFQRMKPLRDSIVILPAHATSIREQDADRVVRSTLQEARAGQALFHMKDYRSFLDAVKAELPENPERYQEIRRVNLGLVQPDENKRKELEIGKNLCGMAKQKA